jgi:GTP-binding protein
MKAATCVPIFEAIVKHVPHPEAYPEKPLQMLITSVDFSEYVGRIAIGRVFSGTIKAGMPVALVHEHTPDQKPKRVKVGKLLGFEGLARKEVDRIEAGDLCAVTGLEDFEIGDTVCDPDHPDPLPAVTVDEPTITMTFRINDSPFAGQEGDFVTSRQIKTRLEKELEHNVALRVEPGAGSDEFMLSRAAASSTSGS